MKLTSELFEQLTGFKESSLEQLQAKGKEDLRDAPRLPLAFRSTACRIHGERHDPPIQIHICDISVLSIGLTHAVEDRLGKTFVITLKPRHKGSPIAIHCEMTHFQSAGQTLIRVGATFVRIGTELDVRHCLGLETATGNSSLGSSTTPTALPTARVLPNTATPVPAAQAVMPVVAGPEPESEEVKRIRDAMLS